jgi:methionyl-tRNA formyltransferase
VNVLLLGYEPHETRIAAELQKQGCNLEHSSAPVESIQADLAVSFGYRHIIRPQTLDSASCPVVNLHISYLPYNRGAHPNFWSFYDGTPSGVSIHLIDQGIDTGPILHQRKLTLNPTNMTFSQTYQQLLNEVQQLFIDNIESILSKNWQLHDQAASGTVHYLADLPSDFSGWDSNIAAEIQRLKSNRRSIL